MPRAETEFKKMAARGMTVVIADGDSGVSSGLGCKKRFAPDWPASSGHVVSVGASVISSYSGPPPPVRGRVWAGVTVGNVRLDDGTFFFCLPTFRTSLTGVIPSIPSSLVR